MRLSTLPGLILGASLGIAMLAFLIGFASGVGERARRGIGRSVVVALSLFVLVGLIGGTHSLALQYGPLVTQEAALLAFATVAALLGGFVIGLFRQAVQPGVTRSVAFMLVVLVVGILGYAHRLNARLMELAREFGVGTAQKYEPEKNKDCPANLASLYTAFKLYAEDNGALPQAVRWEENDELISKVRQDEWLHCPAVSNRHDAMYGYAYNTQIAGMKLNGRKLAEIPHAAKTPLLYDSSRLQKNAADAVASLPRPGRHGGRNNILYCDGHVEAVPVR